MRTQNMERYYAIIITTKEWYSITNIGPEDVFYLKIINLEGGKFPINVNQTLEKSTNNYIVS